MYITLDITSKNVATTTHAHQQIIRLCTRRTKENGSLASHSWPWILKTRPLGKLDFFLSKHDTTVLYSLVDPANEANLMDEIRFSNMYVNLISA